MNKSYCGKKYGIKDFTVGFIFGSFVGYFASFFIYGILVINVIVAIIAGVFGGKIYINYLLNKRKKEFILEFCDYLDAISSSLSCGKNTYEAFIIADKDMEGLYSKQSPICIESKRVANGLKSGRSIDELLVSMSERTLSEDVATFANIYSICNIAGGNLKQTVCDTKNTIIEKINIEREIDASLSAPKNELNIMATMPVIITAALRIFGESLVSNDTIVVNSIAVLIFIASYSLGRKMVKIEV